MSARVARRVGTLVGVLGSVALLLAGGLTDAGAETTGPGALDTAEGLAGAVGHQQRCDGPAVVCADRLAFGLSTPGDLDLGPSLTTLEDAIGHRSDLVVSFQDFTEPLYTDKLRAVVASGRTPVVTWEPARSTRATRDTYPLASIAAGKFDGYLVTAAKQARAVGAPFVIRFAHEMNGFWYPWGQPRPLHPQSIANPANTPAAYVAAYRHVVDVFRARGADNVAWMWSPNVNDANPNLTLRSLYPGDSYVDVVGLSGYLEDTDDTFESRYRATLDELSSIGPGKPVVVAETGAVASPGRPAQVVAMLDAMSAEPRISGVVYFSQPDKTIDYDISSDTATQSALHDVLDEGRWSLPASSAASALTPLVSGTPRVGETLSASYAWRGTPSRAQGSWLSCPAPTTAPSNCRRIGWGEHLALDVSLRGRFVRAALGVVSPSATDFAASPPVGPVLVVPPAVAPAGIDLLSGGARVRLPAPPGPMTHWVLRLDGGAPVYLPSATTEYYANNLATGSAHTVSLAACDCPSTGPATTRSFTQVSRPAAPTYTTSAGGYVVTLPAPATGQTGWVAIADGVEEELPLSTTTVSKTGLSRGSHSFGLRAVAGDARTNPTYVYPSVP